MPNVVLSSQATKIKLFLRVSIFMMRRMIFLDCHEGRILRPVGQSLRKTCFLGDP